MLIYKLTGDERVIVLAQYVKNTRILLLEICVVGDF